MARKRSEGTLRPIRGGRPSQPQKPERGRTRRVVFIPAEGGGVFGVFDAETFWPLTVSSPVIVTVEEAHVGYVPL